MIKKKKSFMTLETNINGIEAEVLKPSVIIWKNWEWKSSILWSVEIWIYWTLYWVRPKVKWEVVFSSEYIETAKKYPLTDIINCRFLEKEPIKKKQTLLWLIDNKNIKREFWKHWKGDIQKSIDYVKDKLKSIKKEIADADTRIEILSDNRILKTDKLTTYADSYDTDFWFVDTTELVTNIEKCKNLMRDIKSEWISLWKDKCESCWHEIKTDENRIKKLKNRYTLLSSDLDEYENELMEIAAYNMTWSQIQENIKLKAEKDIIIFDINKIDRDTEHIIDKLSKLQNDDILRLEEYVKKWIYTEIWEQLKIEDFEIDLSKNFEISYKWKDFKEMSRGQKYTANIYFSIWILRMLNAKIIVIDDAEVLHSDVREEILNDIEDFDYLMAVVSDCSLTY